MATAVVTCLVVGRVAGVSRRVVLPAGCVQRLAAIRKRMPARISRWVSASPVATAVVTCLVVGRVAGVSRRVVLPAGCVQRLA
ncbi:hypothetical protein ACH4U3_40445, partial [Streptomyces griseoruber]|uniref:hypothetical protein n=1 Tax=Streptomyces griseoruber TaxID=1943 RepID=UPI003791D438